MTKPITIYPKKELYEKLKEQAQIQKRSMNNLILFVLEQSKLLSSVNAVNNLL